MYKRSLLSSIATAAIVLFNIQFNVHAESLKVSGEKKEIKDATYETLHVLKEGQITGTDLKVTGNKDTNTNSNENIYVISVEGKGSAIKLTGDKTTIKGTDSDIPLGLEAKDNAILQMTGGTITVSSTGVHFENTNSTENKLENITISSGKNDALLHYGIDAENNSTVALTNVTVSQAENAIVADDHSTITVSGGSFDTKDIAIISDNNSIVTLTNNAQITSSETTGLWARGDSAINMTGGSIKAFYNGASFENSKREENKLENVTISSVTDSTLLMNGILANESTVALTNVKVSQAMNAIIANDHSTVTVSGGSFDAKDATIGSQDNSIITITNNAQITSSENDGLYAKDGGAISMTGGAIKAFYNGAAFENSKREENKLENVTISNGKDDALLHYGIDAEKNSTVALTNVKVSQAESAVVADDHSTITVSGGSFDAKYATIVSKGNSIATLINDVQITSSEDSGLLAKNGGAISMTGGAIKASIAGAAFENSKREKNKLENVTISSVKDDTLLKDGIIANSSTVALTNVKVSQAENAISADNESKITVSGGSFDANNATIGSQGNSIVTIINNAQITSSEDAGLLAKDDGAISMTGGAIKAFYSGAAFENSKREENKLENVTISSGKDDALLKFGIVADKSTVTLNNVTVTKAGNAISADNESKITVSSGSFDAKKATIVSKGNSLVTLTNNAQITSSENDGLLAKDGGAISMTGGAIKASNAGADFENSNSAENKLENVTISSVKDDALLINGIAANKSTVALNNLTVTKAGNAISADNESKITVSGGSFDAKKATIFSQGNSLVTLTNNAQITSSEDSGLLAKNGGAISMTGGAIKAFYNGAAFKNSKREENKLENVTISSGKDDALLHYGIDAEKNSTVALTNVTVSQAENAISANDHSTVTVSGGSFDAKYATIRALNGSIINLTDKTQITSYTGNGLYAEGSESKVTMTGGTIESKADALFAKSSGHIKVTNISIATNGTATGATALGPDSVIELSETTMKNVLTGLAATDGGKITSENLTIIGGKANNSDSDAERSGLMTKDAESEINLTGTTTIQNVDEGLYADGGSKITSGDLTIIGDESERITSAVGSYEPGSKIELNGKTTIKNFDVGLAVGNSSSINMKNGTKNEIDVKKVALFAIANGKIDLENTVVKAGSTGIQLVALSKTNTNKLDDLQTYENNEINLTNTNIHVDNGTGILIGSLAEKSVENSPTLSIGTLNLKDSEIHANALLDDGVFGDTISWEDKNFWDGKDVKEIANGSFTLNADHSILEGRTSITEERNVHFDLSNQAKWILKTSAQEKDDDGILYYTAYSTVSVLNLNDSSVIFKEPTTDGYYHTLHIGYGKPDTSAVYNATGNAQISFNTLWSDGAPIINQQTDRLLIYGDVSGNTNVLVAGYVTKNNSPENNSEAPDNIRGLSLIQVSGKAEEGSFKLVNGYTTLNGSPNKYMLLAYGPNSSHGKAEASQSLVGNNDNFWDFRLQPEFLNSHPGGSGTNPEGSGQGNGGSTNPEGSGQGNGGSTNPEGSGQGNGGSTNPEGSGQGNG
ncbi:beta strand repeat-containing protein, partial [Bartonella raoultii]|uniref:beta strand repeat-containing protein n=1 Tax=Bartonella raoultii TaxID=1457020 RepID=UPI001ABAD763